MFCNICLVCFGVRKRPLLNVYFEHKKSNICLSCQEIILADAWHCLTICWDSFLDYLHEQNSTLCLATWSLGSSSDWFVQRVERDINLLDAPHCKKLLVICILLMKSVCSYLRLTVIKCCLLISCDFLFLFSVNGLFRVNSDRKKSNYRHAAPPVDFTMM